MREGKAYPSPFQLSMEEIVGSRAKQPV